MGERDFFVSRRAIERSLSRMKGAVLVTHPEGGHQLQHDVPEWAAERCGGFFGETECSDRRNPQTRTRDSSGQTTSTNPPRGLQAAETYLPGCKLDLIGRYI